MTSPNDGTGIPVSRRATCVYCGTFIDTNANGVFVLSTGWCEIRRRGGSNAIALPIRHPRFACHECIDRQRHGISPDQGSLFNIDVDLTRIVPGQSLRLVVPNGMA